MYVLLRNDEVIHEDRIRFSSNIFTDINEKYGSRYRKPISVTDDSQKLIFNICWESEYYYPKCKEGKIPFFCNFSGENLCDEVELLDFTFLNKFEVFYFEEINEYSWNIIKLLNHCFGDKKVCTCDPRIKYFENLNVELAEPENDEKTGRFYAGHSLPKEENCWSVYSLMRV